MPTRPMPQPHRTSPAVSRPSTCDLTIGWSCRPNPGRGGWAAIIEITVNGVPEAPIEVSGVVPPITTNMKMEVEALIGGLKGIRGQVREVTVHGASPYLSSGFLELEQRVACDWLTASGAPVPNRQEWEQIIALLESYSISFAVESNKRIQKKRAKSKASSSTRPSNTSSRGRSSRRSNLAA